MKRRTRSEILKSLPYGMPYRLGRIIEMHFGQDNAVNKSRLVELLAQHGFPINDERQIRAAVHELRQTGAPIISSSGASGYWWAANRDEVEVFLDSELRPRAQDLLKTLSALEKVASKEFGPRSETADQPLIFEVEGR